MARTKATTQAVPVLPPALDLPPTPDLTAEPVLPPTPDLTAEPVLPPTPDLTAEPVLPPTPDLTEETVIEGDGPFKVRHKENGGEFEVSAEYLAAYRHVLEVI